MRTKCDNRNRDHAVKSLQWCLNCFSWQMLIQKLLREIYVFLGSARSRLTMMDPERKSTESYSTMEHNRNTNCRWVERGACWRWHSWRKIQKYMTSSWRSIWVTRIVRAQFETQSRYQRTIGSSSNVDRLVLKNKRIAMTINDEMIRGPHISFSLQNGCSTCTPENSSCQESYDERQEGTDGAERWGYWLEHILNYARRWQRVDLQNNIF